MRLLSHLSETDRRRLVGALSAAERLLQPDPPPRASYILRPHRPGDMGWIVHRHGALYGQEYGWDETFEALVAEIAATSSRISTRSTRTLLDRRKDGEIVGSVLLVKQSDEVAKLRLLYVQTEDAGARHRQAVRGGVHRFARSAGYRRLTLWTNDVLRGRGICARRRASGS